MRIRNNKAKTTTAIITSLIIGLVMSSPAIIVPNIQAQTMPNEIIPASPNAIGCYHYTKETGWLTVPCIPESVLKANPGRIPAANIVPSQGGTFPVYGVETTSTSPNHGETDISFTTFGGEFDSNDGTNAWSIQTNTNTFIGSNGDDDWVQFVEQNDPLHPNNNRNCVWQNDLTLKTYAQTCISVPQQTLSSSYTGSVSGDLVPGGSLKSTYCSGGQCWGVVVQDNYGLSTNSNWYDISGTILGVGDKSIANFNHITTESTSVIGSPETSASFLMAIVTGESNNLNYNSHSTTCGSSCTTTSGSNV